MITLGTAAAVMTNACCATTENWDPMRDTSAVTTEVFADVRSDVGMTRVCEGV